jgi:hypothetical protein
MTSEDLRRTDFATEVEVIRGRLADRGWIEFSELEFLLHAEIVAALRTWVEERDDVELVDAIAAIDAAGRRDTLLSWVHLHPDGNRIVADTMARQIVAPLSSTHQAQRASSNQTSVD